MNKPYLSFIVVGRNDNYGHRFLYRFQRFLDNLIYLCEKYKLNSELIIIEWNPPKKNKKLYQDLKIKKRKKYLRIRFIEVPEKIHKTLENSDKFFLFEYIGKNVGIRRSKGDFVLITNPDIIFNEQLILYLSKKALKKNKIYRIGRSDLDRDIPDNLKIEKINIYCRKEHISYAGRYFNISYAKNFRDFIKSNLIYLPNSIKKIIAANLMYNRYPFLKYHGGAPGDFILMHKDDWKKINGFPELKILSGTDGYGVNIAISKGINMVFLQYPLRIYHQFHERPKGRPLYDIQKYRKDIIRILVKKESVKFNNNKWGLYGKKLKEKNL